MTSPGASDFTGDTDGNTCTEISFNDYDTINGPLHTNDAMRVCGDPDFLGDTSTGWDYTTGPGYWPYPSGSCGSNPVFKPGDPEHADALTLPPTNASIKSKTDSGEGGCLFTGSDLDLREEQWHHGRAEPAHEDQQLLRERFHVLQHHEG